MNQPAPDRTSGRSRTIDERGDDWTDVRLIHELSRQLAGSLNVRRTAFRALHFAVPHLGDWAMLAFFDTDNVSVFTTSRGGRVTGPVMAGRLEPNHPLGRIKRRGSAEVYPSGETPVEAVLDALIPIGSLRETASALRPTSVLAVALNIGGATNGVLVVTQGGNRQYGAREIVVAEEFARRVAAALEGARLYEERGQLVAAVEKTLRPPELPDYDGVSMAARYRPGHDRMHLGGDFYDVYGEPDDFTVVIGDVCGKGIDAAVATNSARQTIRTASYFDRSPGCVLRALNDVLRTQLRSHQFVTAACVRFRRPPGSESMTATVAVAGHPPPLVLRANAVVDEPDVNGTVAGILSGLTYTEAEVRLAPKETLLLYTDGVEEARGPEGFFGHERLRVLLPEYTTASPDTLCEAVEQRVVEYLDGAAHDDIALIAVRCGV